MKFKFPGKSWSVRLFEPVETVDSQYHIYDVGVEFAEGGIDSVAAGVAAHSATKWYNDACTKADETQAESLTESAA